MRMDFSQALSSPALSAFNPGERPGVATGFAPTLLSALDKSGVIYKQAKNRTSFPSVGKPVYDVAGMNGTPETADSQHKNLEIQARQLISQTFFGTMLKQMHDSPFKSELFEGGRGGQAFGQLMDQKLVEQMSRGAGKKLVNAVIRKFEANKAYAAGSVDNRNADPKKAALKMPAANTSAELETASTAAGAAAAAGAPNAASFRQANVRTNPRSMKINGNAGFRS